MVSIVENMDVFNTLRPRQNGPLFADDVFKCILWNEKVQISLKISLRFVPKILINIIPALVQIMAWQLAPTRWQAIIWTNDGLGYRRIYASLGLDDLMGVSCISLWNYMPWDITILIVLLNHVC